MASLVAPGLLHLRVHGRCLEHKVAPLVLAPSDKVGAGDSQFGCELPISDRASGGPCGGFWWRNVAHQGESLLMMLRLGTIGMATMSTCCQIAIVADVARAR